MKALFILGTRPEAIKLAPVIKKAKDMEVMAKVCVTGQHRSMLDQVLDFFSISVHHNINVMKPKQTLFDITVGILQGLTSIIDKEKPKVVIVQGDTTTAFSGALAAFYSRVPVVHIEAGLRSNDKFSPYPEEVNRSLVGRLADIHFAPTQRACENLACEGVTENVFTVGNTVIDALFMARDIISNLPQQSFLTSFRSVDLSKKIILITGHRRESFGAPFENICKALKHLALAYPQVEFIYPVHFNPNVYELVHDRLRNLPNFHLIEPLDYPHLVWLMMRCYMVLTDSGGLQEEAPSLGKPVLVMREVTERQEGINAGTARLVGTDFDQITRAVTELIDDRRAYEAMAKAVNPYGDGTASLRIISILKQIYT